MFTYCTYSDNIKVTHGQWQGGFTTVHFEQPHTGNKMDCTVPFYRVSNVEGFSQQEVEEMVDFCRNNEPLLIPASKVGGVENIDM